MSDQLPIKTNLWYIKKLNKVTGPFPVKLIGSYLILGRIDIDTMVSTDKVQWHPINHIPTLIPDEVKDGMMIEGKVKLQQAKVREDERTGDIRRGSELRRLSERDDDGRRTANDRRINDETVSASYLKLKSDIEAQRVTEKKRKLIGLIALILSVSVLMISFLVLDPVEIQNDTDCSAAAAPGIDWRYCNKNSISLVAKNLKNGNLHSVHLNNAVLVKANLTGATLSFAGLQNANLSHAKLNNAKLTGANLNNVNLNGANLSGADLSYADLTNADISGVKVLNTRFDHAIWVNGTQCAPESIDRCIPSN